MRTLAIGDIHGMSGALDALMEAAAPTPDDVLIFMGDYVDRGPDSKGVLDRLIAWSQRLQMVCLRGNHELMMTAARHGRDDLRMWLSVGGAQALASYGSGGRATLADVPPEHWTFLEERCGDYFETDSHIFVHANLHPDVELADQPDSMLFWEFLNTSIDHVSGKTVICGHTSQRSGVPLVWKNTVCIDTHAYGGGWLTCLDVDTRKYWQADALGRVRTGHLQEQD